MHGGPRDDVPRLRLERFVPIARFAIVVAIELVGAHPMGPAAAQLHGPRQLGSSAARLIRDRTTIFRDDLRLGLRELLLGQGAIPFETRDCSSSGSDILQSRRLLVSRQRHWTYARAMGSVLVAPAGTELEAGVGLLQK